MKVINWNLRNIGTTKLNKGLTSKMKTSGLGGTVLDYITKVVMGTAKWQAVTTPVPADLFIIIEERSQNTTERGADATGSCLNVLKLVQTTFNAYCQKEKIDDDYQYNFVTPLTIGPNKKGEAIGFVYNTKVLTFSSKGVLTDAFRNRINPRSPFYADFAVEGANDLKLTAIHAPPKATTGPSFNYSQKPVQYCNQFQNIPALRNMTSDGLITGDYNCNPNSVYYTNNVQVQFNNPLVPGFSTSLPTPTLTSVRTGLTPDPEPANYLSDAFDNIFHKLESADAIETKVLDLIKYATDERGQSLYNSSYKSTLVEKYFSIISDHLPVQITYTYNDDDMSETEEDSDTIMDGDSETEEDSSMGTSMDG